MNSVPDTRESLLIRLGNPADDTAWREFLELYRPLIYRLACRQGFQDADAEDLSQQALLAVAGAIGRWRQGEHEGSFRAWLFTITRNLMTNFVARSRWRSVGGTSFAELLEAQPAEDGSQRPGALVDEEALVGLAVAVEVRHGLRRPGDGHRDVPVADEDGPAGDPVAARRDVARAELAVAQRPVVGVADARLAAPAKSLDTVHHAPVTILAVGP